MSGLNSPRPEVYAEHLWACIQAYSDTDRKTFFHRLGETMRELGVGLDPAATPIGLGLSLAAAIANLRGQLEETRGELELIEERPYGVDSDLLSAMRRLAERFDFSETLKLERVELLVRPVNNRGIHITIARET